MVVDGRKGVVIIPGGGVESEDWCCRGMLVWIYTEDGKVSKIWDTMV